MNKIYLFDVDGTLTPARQVMSKDFQIVFSQFLKNHLVYLVSGSDYSKLREQVPDALLAACAGVYGCSGAQFYKNGEEVFAKQHEFPEALRLLCQKFIDESSYYLRTGNHVENRPGMLNISVVGRMANAQQRQQYFEWDKNSGERLRFVEKINALNLPYEASAGGQISIDVVPLGWNKSIVKAAILKQYPLASLTFFGDRICVGGNDLPLADALAHAPHKAIAVKDDDETLAYLKALLNGSSIDNV